MSTSNITTPSNPPPSSPTYGLTSVEVSTLKEKCIEAKSRAYCPYSNFRVGCAVLLSSAAGSLAGTIITGANVENASYPVGMCAERVALGHAAASGLRSGAFRAIAVATDGERACSPCGMCRQFIREFCAEDVPVIMVAGNGDTAWITVGEMLPMSFGPSDLGK
ncbi:cytidine deaminase [Trichodelitschia bisporula]|uniref:Cytidine deaminase n=1 Tax=Trichodelitschia bisporula TaxID=703511 RepID=A0A6G1HNG3_9PEZI|nr:cytidine deaminase [Trichodelitschia bisporula]